MKNQILNTEQPTHGEILLYDVSYYIHHILKKTQYTDVIIGIAKDPNATDSIHLIKDSNNIIYVSLAFMDKISADRTDLITELYVGLDNNEEEVKNSLNTPSITLGKFNNLNIVSIEVGGVNVGGKFTGGSEDNYFKINKYNVIRLKKDTTYLGIIHREKFVNQCLDIGDYTKVHEGSERDGLVRLPICAISEITNVVNTLTNQNLNQFDMANVIASSNYGLKEKVYKSYKLPSEEPKILASDPEDISSYENSAKTIIEAAQKLDTSLKNKTVYDILKHTNGFDRSLKESGISVLIKYGVIANKSVLEALKELLKRCYNLYVGLYTATDIVHSLKNLINKVEREQIIGFIVADAAIGGSTDSRHAVYICGKDDTNSYLFVHEPNSLNTDTSSINIMHKLNDLSTFRHVSRTVGGDKWLAYKPEYIMTARNATPALLESDTVDELDEHLIIQSTTSKNEIDTIESYRLRDIPSGLNLKALSTGLLGTYTFDIYNKREAITLAILFRLIESDFSDVQNPLYTPISAHDIDYILNGAIGDFWDNIRLLLLVRGYNISNCGNPEYTENKKINTLKNIFSNGRWVILLCDKYDETNIRVGTHSVLCTSIVEFGDRQYMVGFDYVGDQIRRVKIDVTGKVDTSLIHYFVKEYIDGNEVTRKCVPKKLITNIGSPFRTDYTPYNE